MKHINMKKTIWGIIFLLIIQPCLLHAETPRIGATFSRTQCEYLGQDWKRVYLEILGIDFNIIRLGAYWNRIESKEDIYDFSDLDWQIKEAGKKGTPVILTVGMKAPRWPEYFIPDWVLKRSSLRFGADVATSDYLRERALGFIRKVINRYKDKTIICCWQVENEPLNRAGPKHWWIDKDFLKEEVLLVKRLDKRNRPILINIATYPNKFLRFIARLTTPNDPVRESVELCDILGLNVYPVVGHRLWGLDLLFRTRVKERSVYFTKIIALAENNEKKVWVTELQAEPWEPGQLVHKGEERPTTCLPEDLDVVFEEMSSLGINTILLWGAEYWYFRKTCHRDESWWKKVTGFFIS